MNLLNVINNRHNAVGFVSTWRTTTPNETIQLPTIVLYIVDWGDGTVTDNATSHEYLLAGDYVVKMSGYIADFRFAGLGDVSKIIDVSVIRGLRLQGANFQGCFNLDVTATEKPVFKSGSGVFIGCTNLVFNPSINLWDWSEITETTSMFLNAVNFNQFIDFTKMTSLTVCNTMFLNCESFDQIINLTNSPLLTMGQQLLNGCTNFNSEINISSPIISYLRFLRDCSSFNSPITVNTSQATSLKEFHRGNTVFNRPVIMDTAKVTDMREMYLNASAFNQDISDRDYSKITQMSNFMQGKGVEYHVSFMDNLYIKLDNAIGGLVFANMSNVNISFGTINYTSVGATARASLVSKGFIISSGIEV